MKGKRSLCAVLLLSSILLAWGSNAFAVSEWAPIPIGGIPVGISPSAPAETPVGPPPPNMMPPVPPPPGDTATGTVGTSEYGSTTSGGTVTLTTGTEPGKGPGMTQLGSPLLLPPYAPRETQTDEVLRKIYPEGNIRVRPNTAPVAYSGSPLKAGSPTTPASTGLSSAAGAPTAPWSSPPMGEGEGTIRSHSSAPFGPDEGKRETGGREVAK